MPPKPGSPSNRPLWSEEFSVHAAEDAYVLRGSSGFAFHEGSNGKSKVNLFGGAKRTPRKPMMDAPM